MYGLLSQDRWDKTRCLIAELVGMEREESYGMPRFCMGPVRWFLVYIARTYRGITPYVKGSSLTIYSKRTYSDE